MPDRADHLRQARANLAFAEHLVRTRPDDPTALQWAVTVAFYAALHSLDAYLVGRGISCQTHQQRRAAMAQPTNGVPPAIYAYYRQLEDWSRQARYSMLQFKSGFVEHTILAQYLSRVTRFVGL